MDIQFYAELVERMREAQNKYFRDRSAAALNESKNLERMVDSMTESFLHPDKNQNQGKLF